MFSNKCFFTQLLNLPVLARDGLPKVLIHHPLLFFYRTVGGCLSAVDLKLSFLVTPLPIFCCFMSYCHFCSRNFFPFLKHKRFLQSPCLQLCLTQYLTLGAFFLLCLTYVVVLRLLRRRFSFAFLATLLAAFSVPKAHTAFFAPNTLTFPGCAANVYQAADSSRLNHEVCASCLEPTQAKQKRDSNASRGFFSASIVFLSGKTTLSTNITFTF